MNDEIAIKVNDIHKEFILPQSKNTSFKQAAINIVRKNNNVTQKVLDGVSFEIKKGDFFGIVGRNGSGKSTLLKLIAGVYTPTAGAVEINGGLTPFIELGVGFNTELSGRDNVYLNGALLGFTRPQMDNMYDEIVEFAELGPFMDQKLKNYSSGMQVRLAFSIAIKAKNDILIFDEVLAVGDEAFQRKCLDVFESYKASGQTVVLVTHDMETVRKFCTRAVLISDGKLIESGSPHEVATKYSMLNTLAIDDANEKKNAITIADQEEKSLEINVVNHAGKKFSRIELNEDAIFNIILKNTLLPENFESVGMTIVKQSGEHIGGINSRHECKGWNKRDNLNIKVKIDFTPGTYWVLVEIFSQPGKPTETIVGPTYDVYSNKTMEWSGLTHLKAEWIKEN
jgi:ABC-2 type transport system ATP-binding protein